MDAGMQRRCVGLLLDSQARFDLACELAAATTRWRSSARARGREARDVAWL